MIILRVCTDYSVHMGKWKKEWRLENWCLVAGTREPPPVDLEKEEEREEKSKQDKIELVGTDGAGETRSKFKIRISKARRWSWIRKPGLMAGDSWDVCWSCNFWTLSALTEALYVAIHHYYWSIDTFAFSLSPRPQSLATCHIELLPQNQSNSRQLTQLNVTHTTNASLKSAHNLLCFKAHILGWDVLGTPKTDLRGSKSL